MECLFILIILGLAPVLLIEWLGPPAGFAASFGLVIGLVFLAWLFPYGEWRWKKNRKRPL